MIVEQHRFQFDTWKNLPIQSEVFDTCETIYLAFGNNFRYEPHGAGIKHISIVASEGIVNSKSFRLEIVDGGDFPIEWASNIRWKNDTEPIFQQYHTDVLMFHTYDYGTTWIGEPIQSIEMTPYWKVKVIPRGDQWNLVQETSYMTFPIEASAIDYIDWGDGTIEEAPFSNIEDGFPHHSYSGAALYTIVVKSTKFNTGYFFTNSDYLSDLDTFIKSVVEVVNPLPALKGSYQYDEPEDGILIDIFNSYISLESVPDQCFKNNPYPVGAKCFSDCHMLTAIPPNLFANDQQITNFSSAFYNCYSLKSIPSDIFANYTSATDFSYCFYRCESLIIPSDIFSHNTTATNFSHCFQYCFIGTTSDRTAIPAGLFDNCTAATDFSSCFSRSGISSIPAGIFDNCTSATNFSECFSYCLSLRSISSGLFSHCSSATNFSKCFYYCRNLQSIPDELFKDCSAATNFTNCFYYCQTIANIPAGLFKHCSSATDFGNCFYECSAITSAIPAGLFDDCLAATSFNNCFYNCSNIASIPSGLFDHNVAAKTFMGCFYNCKLVPSIPSGLFNNNAAATSFAQCFYNCQAIQSIPTGLFNNNTLASEFTSCFYNCKLVPSIPTGLFDNNTAATSFSSCFSGCSSITSIPSGLFDKNIAATSFAYCFQGCSITSIPSGLFTKNTAVTTFTYCFNNCTNLGAFTIHIGSQIVEYCSYFVTKKTTVTRTVYVPTSSKTYLRFNSYASNLGLTVVGE